MLAGASLNQQQEPASGTGKQLEFAYTKAGAMCLPPSPPEVRAGRGGSSPRFNHPVH